MIRASLHPDGLASRIANLGQWRALDGLKATMMRASNDRTRETPMIIVHASATAIDGNLEELLAESRAHVARSLTEPGCISHEVTQGVNDPNRLVFAERWADMDALQTHFEVEGSREFGAAVARLTGGAFTLEMYEAEELTGP